MKKRSKDQFTGKMFGRLWAPAMVSSLALAVADMADAIAAYEKMGYQICEGFGDFTDDHAVTCMEKEISDGTMR